MNFPLEIPENYVRLAQSMEALSDSLLTSHEVTLDSESVRILGPSTETPLLEATKFYYQNVLDWDSETLTIESTDPEPREGTTYIVLDISLENDIDLAPLLSSLREGEYSHFLLTQDPAEKNDDIITLTVPDLSENRTSFPIVYLTIQLLGACLDGDTSRIERLVSVAGALEDQFRRARVAVELVRGSIDHPLEYGERDLVDDIPGLDPSHPNQEDRRWAIPEENDQPISRVNDFSELVLAGSGEFNPIIREGSRTIERQSDRSVRVVQPGETAPDELRDDFVVILSNFRTESRDAEWVEQLTEVDVPVAQISCCLSEVNADWLFHVTRRKGPEDSAVLYLPYLYELGRDTR